MSKKQNIGFRVFLSFFLVGLGLVFSPYLVNQLPTPSWVKDLPTLVKILGAVFFALIIVVVPELLKVEETPPEELWRKLLQENQKLINERLKNSLDQDRHIPIPSIDSPDDLERPQRKTAQQLSVTAVTTPTPASSPQKGGRKWWQIFQPPAILQNAIADKFPPIKTRRNLENLQTEEVTQLPPSKPIVEIFKEANKRLLILGEPGSGKTTELLKLAQALGEEAKKNPEKPIPFIFELSAWRGESMLEWMVGEIVAQYGLNPTLCQEWLVHNRIVPLLDGLDELGRYNNGIKEAILALNSLQEDYHKQQHSLVICCRVKDYESITDDNNCRIRLKEFERAVRLCELADDQIEWYLQQRKAEHIWDELQSNSGLMALARNPMLLNLMPIAYPDELPDNLPQNFQDCQSRLFEDFLHRKLYPPQSITPHPLCGYEPEKARYYLAWLAASMGRQDINQREFLIEQLQPNWLETKQQRHEYSLIAETLIGGPIGGILGAMTGGVIGGLIGGLILGPIGIFYSIELIENFEISHKKIKKAIYLALYYSLFGGLIGLIAVPISGLIIVPIFGLIVGIIEGLVEGLKTDIKIRKYPNQGIWETGLKSLITMGIAIPLCPFIFIVPQWAKGQDWSLNASLMGGIFFAIFLGYWIGGGEAFTKHFILRWVLCHHGRIPRNYAHFLTEASQSGILKQSGGRYRFYHDKFREYLAATIQLNFEPVSSLKRSKFFIFLQALGITFTWFVLAIILSSTFEASPETVKAMTPVIQTTDRLWYDALTYRRWRNPQRYQVIRFSTDSLEENFSNELAYRRILALPGERLEISSGQIILNGKPFSDNRIKLPSDFNQALITLADDEYYVVADNLNYANFETFGAVVPLQNIRGQLVLRVYPFERFGLIR